MCMMCIAWGCPGWPKGVVNDTEYWTQKSVVVIEELHQDFKYYQRWMLFRVKVLFLAPVVENCTCLTCHLVWCGCCWRFTRCCHNCPCWFIRFYSLSTILSHFFSSSYGPRKRRLFDDVLFCGHISFIEKSH